ncbi:hypothetical protein TNCV_3740981 [Trichonephila clavipes]|nr:hypothetical protein TNCV_3740981 [Trichonephila clavipes]
MVKTDSSDHSQSFATFGEFLRRAIRSNLRTTVFKKQRLNQPCHAFPRMSRMETGSPISINEYTERLRICAEIEGHDNLLMAGEINERISGTVGDRLTNIIRSKIMFAFRIVR